MIDLDRGWAVANHTDSVPGEEAPFKIRMHCAAANGDPNSDKAIDLRDLALLQGCFTGTDVTECGSGCPTLDLDGDDDIDRGDDALFSVEFGDR